MATKQAERRKARVRRTIKAASGGRPRLSVFRSSKHIYAQVIDDRRGATVAAASSLEKDMRASQKTGADIGAAKSVGKLVAERATAAGETNAVAEMQPRLQLYQASQPYRDAFTNAVERRL